MESDHLSLHSRFVISQPHDLGPISQPHCACFLMCVKWVKLSWNVTVNPLRHGPQTARASCCRFLHFISPGLVATIPYILVVCPSSRKAFYGLPETYRPGDFLRRLSQMQIPESLSQFVHLCPENKHLKCLADGFLAQEL